VFSCAASSGVCTRKRDYFQSFRNKSVQTPPCEGTYFQVVYAAISTENDVAFVLITEYGVAASHFNFYENGKDLHLIRFCFARQRYSGRSGELCKI
jgi:methionine aminotransferase